MTHRPPAANDLRQPVARGAAAPRGVGPRAVLVVLHAPSGPGARAPGARPHVRSCTCWSSYRRRDRLRVRPEPMGDAVLADLRLPPAPVWPSSMARTARASSSATTSRTARRGACSSASCSCLGRDLARARDGGHRLLRPEHRSADRAVRVTLVTGRGPSSRPVAVHELDAVVVGAGGAGLYAALELKQDLGPEARIGVISKLYPRGRTPAPRRAASAPRSGTPRRTTGSGIGSTRSRAATTSSTRTRPR